MPELPEVETHVRDLQVLIGARLIALSSNTPKAFQPSFAALNEKLLGKKILTLTRRAKYLIFTFSGGLTLVVHFRMTGHFLIRQPADPLEKAVRHHFTLRRGHEIIDLRFSDIRKFGTLTLCETSDSAKICGFTQLGPEPLEKKFTPKLLVERLKARRGKLKAVLLDQTCVAGIGNIYADEICFRARLSPLSRVEKLTPAQIKKLHAAIVFELSKGVKNRGTTIGEYVDSSGQPGKNQKTLKVYSRGGKSCYSCGEILQKTKVAQRTTVFCKNCQNLIV